jgi:hypothetical protein
LLLVGGAAIGRKEEEEAPERDATTTRGRCSHAGSHVRGTKRLDADGARAARM